MLKIALMIIVSLFISTAKAGDAPQPLTAEKAFEFTTYVDAQNHITFQWVVAPGYFLYQNKFNFTLSPVSGVTVGDIQWPSGIKNKIMHGVSFPIYSGLVKVTVPLLGAFRGPLTLTINYQGCSLSGFCYAPIKKYLHINTAIVKPLQDLTPQLTLIPGATPVVSDQDMTHAIFAEHSLIFILLSFLGLGLLLAFTPCVLPMIPILSGIIVGHKAKVSTARAFSLSLAYVLGMAIMYAVAGMIVAELGSSLQIVFQKPWVIVLFSCVFVILSLSLFGLYELRLPNHWHARATRWSDYFNGGSYVSVFFMGCISTLIVSPCVSAPLVGVLAYIAQTGNAVLGATALLMLGLGMGIPLLIIGTSAGKWLPKAGHWMDLVKKVFGVLMLGVAVWMLSRIIPGSVTLFLWSLLLIATGVFITLFYKAEHRGVMVLRIIATVVLMYGLILMVGSFMGGSDPFAPWDNWRASRMLNAAKPDAFTVINNQAELDKQLHLAQAQHKIVVLDFYADWCTSCVLMDHHVFDKSDVRHALSSFVRLRIDMTTSSAFHKAVMARYHVIAPPTMLFINSIGQELVHQRIVGEVSINQLLAIVATVKES